MASARAKAAEARAVVAAGDDPIVVRQRASAPENLSSASPGLMTFRNAVDAFLPGHLRTLSNAKHRAQWRSTLEVYAADLMPLRCAEITAARVSDCLSPIWLEIPETASRRRQRVELVLAYADAREDRDRSNPAALRGPLRFSSRPRRNECAITRLYGFRRRRPRSPRWRHGRIGAQVTGHSSY